MKPPDLGRREFVAGAVGLGIAPFVMNMKNPSLQDGVGFAFRKPKPLGYEEIPGFLSKAQLAAHHTAHYGGALKSLVQIEQELESANRKAANANYSQYRALRREQSLTMNSVFLHEIYFDGMTPKPADAPERIRKVLVDRFGTFERWIEDFTACAAAARGWAILGMSAGDGKLYNIVEDSHDAGLPWATLPLVVCDVYEHAYYIDYQSKKASYVDGFVKHIHWTEIDARSGRSELAVRAWR
ncbi:MAG: superoxide dismutase [Planctomycetes bacterium]|nr:superoxide dismutase [Planctomycetota bacterium]